MGIRAMIIHSFMVKNLKENETVDLLCSIGGREFPLRSASHAIASEYPFDQFQSHFTNQPNDLTH
jgi:hypothetical protein